MAFYVTTPIYYVNGTPHVGHAYTTIAADTITRWKRLTGEPAYFLTGTDEHGQKVLEAAERRGMSPQAHCDDLVVHWKAMMERLHVRYDRFLRTTDADHVALVQHVLQHLFDRGEIYRAEYQGWYLVKDEVFVTDKEREERIASGELPESAFRMIEESNWFFRMSKYQDRLLAHLRAHPDTILPENRLNEVLGFLQKPLGDLCISRPKSRMSWGIELPFDRDFVCYVWFDALLNYVTGAPGFAFPGATGAWPADFQLLGKDILTTHAVYWTTMLLALDLPLPKHLFAHGWWVSADGQKMSKSLGNVIDVNVLLDAFGVDATRYFLLREIRFGADGQFSYQGFFTKVNADLANDLGNLGHRTGSMVEKWLGGVVPERAAPDPGLAAKAADVLLRYRRAMDALGFKEALDAVFELIDAGNKHVDAKAPWALNKAGKTDELRAVMRDVLEIWALAGVLLAPVLPTKAPVLAAKLGTTVDALAKGLAAGAPPLCLLTPGAPLTVGEPLFPRFEEMPPQVAALFTAPPAAAPPAAPKPKEKPVSETKPADAAAAAPQWIEYPDFEKVALRVGKVLEAGPHPNADKLLVLKVDLGEANPRTICAGIKSKFAPESLVGRNVVVVANLKPRPMRGITSEGMILAAGGDEVVDLVSVNAAPGDRVR
jgi:methionyl-tRNA synthetase